VAMKWCGWGEEDVCFTHDDKPELAPFIARAIGLDVRRPGTSVIAFEELEIGTTASARWPALTRADLGGAKDPAVSRFRVDGNGAATRRSALRDPLPLIPFAMPR
jgi:hypothetical protein